MKDLDYFILEELTKDEFEELTKKYGATKKKGMPTDLLFDWVAYRNKHRAETDKYLAPIIKKEVETLNDREKKLWINLPYKVDIYNGLVTKADLNKTEGKPTPKYSTSIPLADLYPTAKERPEAIPQKAAAVYVNVFQGKTMNATWHYDDTYAADEIAE